MEFIPFNRDRYDELLKMMLEFYTSDAVDHPIPSVTITKLLDDIVSGEHQITGIQVKYDGNLAGFGIVTKYYTSEVAGITVQLEDLYIKEEYRSKGIGKKYFDFVMNTNPNAKRFRLEVSPQNKRAISLYEQIGFSRLDYNQMIIDL